MEKTKVKKSIEEILEEMSNHVSEYEDNHVDLVIENQKNVAYIMYHSRHDSFGLSEVFNLEGIDKKELEKRAEAQDFSVCMDD